MVYLESEVSRSELEILARKLKVSIEDVDRVLDELSERKVFVHFEGDSPPQVDGVVYFHVFYNLKVASAKANRKGLLRLLLSDEVTCVEPVPEVEALGGGFGEKV